MHTQQKYSPFSNLSALGRTHVSSLFTNEEHKRVGLWRNVHVCHTCKIQNRMQHEHSESVRERDIALYKNDQQQQQQNNTMQDAFVIH